MYIRIIISVFILAGTTTLSVAQDKILIAAASDLRFAMDSIVNVFSREHRGIVNVTYGSSGKFHEQILNGAPFDIFFSADILYPEKLKEAKLVSSEIYAYAKGRIVLWSKAVDPAVKGMATLNNSALKKIAIANPMHAPYGKRAMESLEYYKLTTHITDRLVYGENISQTAQFISTGAADIGIIALSIALSPNMQKEKGHYYLIPENTHQPLVQGAVITTTGRTNKLAASFFSFIKEDKAIAILKYFGFTQP